MKSIYILCLVIFSFSIVAVQKADIKLPKTFKKSFAFIPSGKVFLDNDTVTVQSFFIEKTEVTNGEYKLFLDALERTNDAEKLAIAKVNEDNWNSEFEGAYLKPMANNYFSHPAYSDYPVVNISQKAALLYCDWLQDSLMRLSPDLNCKIRLPYHAEIVRAGGGEEMNRPYPWDGLYLRNKKGCYLLNFNPEDGRDTTIKMSDDGGFHQVKVESYLPSDFDVYNLCGNVAEMINEENVAVGGGWSDNSEGVMLRSRKDFNMVSATVGFRPVFTFTSK